MPRPQLNVRIPPLTQRELNWLKQHFGMSGGEIVTLAIDYLYHRDDTVSKINRDLSRALVDAIVQDDAVLDHD